MNIFEMAINVTIKQGGSEVNFIDNAIKIRKFLDKKPKLVKALYKSDDKLKEGEKRYIRQLMAKMKKVRLRRG